MTTYRVPVREIGLIAFGTAALYLFLAVASHSPNDPSFSFSGEAGEVRNWVGASGAYLSDLMLTLFGFAAYGIPFALAAAGWRLVQKPGTGRGWVQFAVRSSGWVAVVACVCALIRMHALASPELPSGTGGLIGQWLFQRGMPVFGVAGLTLLGLAGILVGGQAALGFSWLDAAEACGRHLHRVCAAALGFALRRLEVQRARRAERAAARARAALRRAPEPGVAGDLPKAAEKEGVGKESAGKEGVAKEQKQEKRPSAPRPKPPAQARTGKPSPADASSPPPAGSLPAMDLLDERAPDDGQGYSQESLDEISQLLELKLKDFGVDAQVVSVMPGPVVTRFELQPAPGVKVQKISALAKDLARSLAVISVRIVEIIPGKSVVGIEIPNKRREMVRLKEIFTAKEYETSASPLSLALGKDIAGVPVVADISRMPHLLIAGTTGSGKSVGVNAMLLSILYKSGPEEVRLILVDPKMLELSVYEGIPHLLAPVVTDMKEAAQALNWCVAEMERRYKLMAALGVRNLKGFNTKVRQAQEQGEPIADPLWEGDEAGQGGQAPESLPELQPLPFILVVIDEFADMMMIVGKKVEQLIARIAQKARAAGIHLVLATQRPSVDVITGLIKANIPARLSFQVATKVDSRTILDQGGAEQLLGHGDMLYQPPGTSVPVRVHGAFVSDEEVHRVASDWQRRGQPDYAEGVLSGGEGEPFVQLEEERTGSTEQDDPLYDEAAAFVLESRRASISSVQRKLRIGYNRAARLIEAMEEAGLVSKMNSDGSREVLVPGRD